MKRVYLDYNATTPVHPSVREAMMPYLGEDFGNPSSLHWAGARAKKAIEESREKIAGHLGCQAREIIFTSGGTESNYLALRGTITTLFLERGRTAIPVLTTQVEHPAVLRAVEALEREGLARVMYLEVNAQGTPSIEQLEEGLKEGPGLVSVIWTNNETGTISPIVEMAERCKARKILFHTDAVQTLGKRPIDLSQIPVDLMSFSGHKIYGPKGIGMLFVRKGTKLTALFRGGAQEMEKRAGTENVPGIVGLAAAMDIVTTDLAGEMERQRQLRNRLEGQLRQRLQGVSIHGNPKERLDNTLNMSFEGIDRDLLLIALDREGIAVSSGSACASGTTEASHVLKAMGVPPEESKGAIRFSLGRNTTEDDIHYVFEKVSEVVGRMRGVL